MKPIAFVVLSLLAACLAQTAAGDTFNIAGIANQGGFAFSSGTYMASARSSVTNPANFGPAGIVQHTVNVVPDLAVIDAGSLAGVDILVTSAIYYTYTAAEAAAIRTWVDAGGSLIFYGDVGPNFGASSNSLATAFGITYSTTDWGIAPPVQIDQPGHPIFSGPFGASALVLDDTGSIDSYADALMLAHIIGGGPGSGKACALAQDFSTGLGSCGEAVWYTDVNIIANNFGLYDDNEVLWLNSVAYVIETVSPTATRESSWSGVKALF